MADHYSEQLETRLLYLGARYLDDCLTPLEQDELKGILASDISYMKVFAQLSIQIRSLKTSVLLKWNFQRI